MAYRRTPAVEQRQAVVRERIVAAALGLVAESGYAGCAVTEVARRAGVGTGTLYGYFASKGDLLAEVFRTAVTREVAAAVQAGREARAEQDGCCCQPLLAAVSTFATRAALSPRLAYALLAEPVDVAVDLERLAFRQAWSDLLAATVREGVELGQLPPQDPDVTAAAVLGAVAEVLVRPLATGTVQPEPYAAVVASLLSFTRRSLGGAHDHHARGHQPGAAARGARRG